MKDLDSLLKTKTCLEKLANGINPTNNQPIDDDHILNDVRVLRCLFNALDVLNCVIQNGGTIANRKRREFTIEQEKLENFPYSEQSITMSVFLRKINELVDLNEVKKLTRRGIIEKLLEMKLLEDAQGRYGQVRLCPSQLGIEMGMTMEKRMGYKGSHYGIYYSKKAQEFLIDNLQMFL